jgi:hypothetical protein
VTGSGDYSDIESFASVINTRLEAEARISKGVAFGWMCGGWAIAACLFGFGIATALYGYAPTMVCAAMTSRGAIAKASL